MKKFSNPIFLFIGLLLVATSVFAQPVNVTYSHTDPLDPNGIIWSPVYNPGSLPEIFFVANTSNGAVTETLIGNAYEDGTFINSKTITRFTDGQILYTDDEGVLLAGKDLNHPNELSLHKFDHSLNSQWNLSVKDVLPLITSNQSTIAMLKYYQHNIENYLIATTGFGITDPTLPAVQTIAVISVSATGGLNWAKFYFNSNQRTQQDFVSTITEYTIAGNSYFAIGGTTLIPQSLFTLAIDINGTIVTPCNFYTSNTSLLQNPILKWDGSDLVCAYTDGNRFSGVNSGASIFKMDVNNSFTPSAGNYIWQGTDNKATGLEIRQGEYVVAMEVRGYNPLFSWSNSQVASAIVDPLTLTTNSFSRFDLNQNHGAKIYNSTIDPLGQVYMVAKHLVAGAVDELRLIKVDMAGNTCHAEFLTAYDVSFPMSQSIIPYSAVDLYVPDQHVPNEVIAQLTYRDCEDARYPHAYKGTSLSAPETRGRADALIYPTKLTDKGQYVTIKLQSITEDLHIELLDITGRKTWTTVSKGNLDRVIIIPEDRISIGLNVIHIYGKTFNSIKKITKTY